MGGWSLRRLRARGITWARIWEDDPDAQREPADGEGLLPKPRRIERAAAAFKRHAKWLAGQCGDGCGSFAIGSGFNINPMVVPFVGSLIGTVVSVPDAHHRLLPVAIDLACTPSDALGEGWKEIAAVSDDRPRYVQLNDADGASLPDRRCWRRSHGDTVRNAVDDPPDH